MFGLVTRRRHNAELAAVKAEADRLRAERDATVSKLATAVYNREQVLRQNAEQDAANRRLHGRILELSRRLSAVREADPEYAASLERRVARLRLVGVRILAAYAAEKKRADRLQTRLDDACGLDHPAVTEGAAWQARRMDKPRPRPTTAKEASAP